MNNPELSKLMSEYKLATPARRKELIDIIIPQVLPLIRSYCQGCRPWNTSPDDVVQQVVILLMRTMDKYDPTRGSAECYIRIVADTAKSACMEFHKAKKRDYRRTTSIIENVDSFEFEDDGHHTVTPDQNGYEAIEYSKVREMWEFLDENDYQELKYWAMGFTAKQITTMGISQTKYPHQKQPKKLGEKGVESRIARQTKAFAEKFDVMHLYKNRQRNCIPEPRTEHI